MRKAVIATSIIVNLLILGQLMLILNGLTQELDESSFGQYHLYYDEENYADRGYWENDKLLATNEPRILVFGVNYYLYSEVYIDGDGVEQNVTVMFQENTRETVNLGLINQEFVCDMKSFALVKNSSEVTIINLNDASTTPLPISPLGFYECSEFNDSFFLVTQNGEWLNISNYYHHGGLFSTTHENLSISTIGSLEDIDYELGEMFFLSSHDEYNRTISKFDFQSTEFSTVVNLSVPFGNPAFYGSQGGEHWGRSGTFFDVRDGKIGISLNGSVIDVIDVKDPSVRNSINVLNHKLIQSGVVDWLEFGCNGTILFSTYNGFRWPYPYSGVIYDYNESRIAAVVVEWEGSPIHSFEQCSIAYKFDQPWKDWMLGTHQSNYTRNAYSFLIPDNLSVENSTLIGYNDSMELLEEVQNSNNNTFNKQILVNFSFNVGPLQELVDVNFTSTSGDSTQSNPVRVKSGGNFSIIFSEFDIPLTIISRDNFSFRNYQDFCSLIKNNLLNGILYFIVDDFYSGLIELQIPVTEQFIELSGFQCKTPFTTIQINSPQSIQFNTSSEEPLAYNFTDQTVVLIFDYSPNLWIRHPSEISFIVKTNGEVKYSRDEEIYHGTNALRCVDFLTRIHTSLNQTADTITCLNYVMDEASDNDENSSPPNDNHEQDPQLEDIAVNNGSSNNSLIDNLGDEQSSGEAGNQTIELSNILTSDVFYLFTATMIVLTIFSLVGRVKRIDG